MDIRHLRSFVAVAQYLNFTEAAKRIYIGQPALSRQINDLEKQIGVELFIRTSRSVRLTTAGATLLKEANALIAKVDEVVEKTRQAYSGAVGGLKIGCFGVEGSIFPQMIKDFRTLYPHISIDIQILTSKEINDGLEQEELDVGFTGFWGNNPQSSFMLRIVDRTKLCFVLLRDHPYANQASLDISALAQERFIMLPQIDNPASFEWFVQKCKKAGFTPNIINQSPRLESIFWQVEAGLGISVFPRDIIFTRFINPSICFVDMCGNDAFGNIAVAWKQENKNPSIPLFIKEIEDIK
ncbi:MAG TPA: LysR family transcriptional regulator [Negativicutes bacterium]|jgi:DNA-binding transcriptional LysR family regulator